MPGASLCQILGGGGAAAFATAAAPLVGARPPPNDHSGEEAVPLTAVGGTRSYGTLRASATTSQWTVHKVTFVCYYHLKYVELVLRA